MSRTKSFVYLISQLCFEADIMLILQINKPRQLTKAKLIAQAYHSNKCKVKFSALSTVSNTYSANDWNEVQTKSLLA